eukprot:9072014-Karenia_brevis.AAC.1
MLVRRETLAIFNAVYPFVHEHYNEVTRLPGAVFNELRRLRSILPMLYSNVDAGWDSTIYCSDASPTGIGVCARSLDVTQVGHIGRQAEKWRYLAKEHIQARAAALNLEIGSREHTALDSSPFIIGSMATFDEIPKSICNPKDWKLLHVGKIKKFRHITFHEGRAFSWSVLHTGRNTQLRNKRLLFLLDNMSL